MVMHKMLLLSLCIFLNCFSYGLAIEEHGWSSVKIEEPAEIMKEMTSKEPVNIKVDPYFQQLIKGVNQFAFDVYQQIKNRRGNIFFSPYALAIGMNMVGLGSTGQTASEIQNVLHYSLKLYPLIHDINQFLGANTELSKSSQLLVTDALWLQQGIPFLPSFQFSLKKSFEESLQFVDFEHPSQAINTVNNWISKATKNRINQILSAGNLNKNSLFIVTTALFWKGEWLLPFDRRSSLKAPFNYRGHPFQVEMMKQIADYAVVMDERFEIVEIPFKRITDNNSLLSMIVFLPKDGIELSSLESDLNAKQWGKWMSSLSAQPIELNLPKFRVNLTLDLDTILKDLGIRQAFEPSADFSGISVKEKVYLNTVLHKTAMRIDESGSNAGIALPTKNVQKLENPTIIKIDRPFFFVIQDKETNLILSVGRIVQP